ncbi:lasso peptide biosynthesis PqqD family chaperone [Paenibacillus sp. CAU 1782]
MSMVIKQDLLDRTVQMTFSLQLSVVQSYNYIASDMNGERVLLCVDSGKYYNLGAIGTVIWDLLEKPVTVGSVVQSLLDEYEIDRPSCEAEVFAFLARLSEERLIRFGV